MKVNCSLKNEVEGISNVVFAKKDVALGVLPNVHLSAEGNPHHTVELLCVLLKIRQFH
jgi:hypothetical protein